MAELLADTKLRLESVIKDNYPSVDIAPGTVLNELLIKLNAVLQNEIVNSTNALNQANSIASVINSATDTFSPIIDAIASNYNTSRGAGKKSVGKIKVIVTDNTSYFIKTGFTFNQPVINLNYIVKNDYSVVTNPTDVDELPLVKEGSLYYFIIPVEAEFIGAEYQVSDAAKFSIATGFSLTGFADALAYGSFVSGLPADTDKVLIARYQEGLSNKSLLTPKSILFRLQQLYPNVRDISIVGANDKEMTRSKHNIFGLSTLGMVDVYVRASLGAETIQITKTATQTNNVWSLSLGKNDVPGFYRIVSILPSGKGLTGTLLNTPVFNYSTAGVIPTNVVSNVREARFTKYQTCNVTFEYLVSDTTLDFDIVLAYQPNIKDIQDLFLNSDERIACADYLVKAVLPCFVSVGLRVHRRNPKVELPIDKIKQDIYNYINTIPFGDNLHVSKIIDICHNYDVLYVEFPIKLTGDIYTDSSTVLSISSTDLLVLPTDLSVGVSPKTTVFFADYFKTGTSDLLNKNSMSESISIEVI